MLIRTYKIIPDNCVIHSGPVNSTLKSKSLTTFPWGGGEMRKMPATEQVRK